MAKTSVVAVALLLAGCGAQVESDESESVTRSDITSERAEESGESENTAASSLGDAAASSPEQSESGRTVDSAYDTYRYVEVRHNGVNYLCETTWSTGYGEYECVRYYGGTVSEIYSPDLYCTGSASYPTCTDYDPSIYFEVRDGGSNYICKSRNRFSPLGHQYDCVRYVGGAAPLMWNPVLFCSGPRTIPSCSSNWYPDELERHDIYTISGVNYICRSATFGSWGDSDCYRYRGGDPSMSIGGLVDLYCSESGYSMSCSADDYPSVWEDYSVFRIGMRDYICDESAWGDAPCVRYSGGSPSKYSFWNPDYYCTRFGSCYQN